MISEPILRIRASKYGGSGYAAVTWLNEKGKPTVVPGVTTVLNALPMDGIVQWHIDNTAAYAVANVDALLNRTVEQGFGFLRWYTKRKPDLSDPLRDFSKGVLNDAAELGTNIHTYIAADLEGEFTPPIDSPEMAQMVDQWSNFKSEHTIEPILTEATVLNREEGYAGTLDGLWKIDGVPTLVDVKSARSTRDSHWAQVASLGACYDLLTRVGEGEGVKYRTTPPRGWDEPVDDDGKITTYWKNDVIPPFSQYRLLHIRPSDYDNQGNPIAPFCKLVSTDVPMGMYYDLFLAALKVKRAQKSLKDYEGEEVF